MDVTQHDRLDGTELWPGRYLTGGRIVIGRPAPTRRERTGPSWLQRGGREWRRLRTPAQWIIVVLVAGLISGPFRRISDDAGTAVFLVLLIAEGLLIAASRERTPARPPVRSLTPEETLALSDTTEARVAGAACRAWAETVREPAWQSPYLAQSRAAFDGQAEVDQIVDLAVRIGAARLSLGARPDGPAGEYWVRQHEALEAAARRLGGRADALIRYRDQAGRLSTELRNLADLERMERAAVEIDGLTIETAYASGRGDGGLARVSDDIAGVRAAMTELLELMTRTRAPLAEPPGSVAP